MVQSIQEIFMLLHIDVVRDKVDRVHHMIRELWVAPVFMPDDYDDFCRMITSYYQYHHKAYLGGPTMPEDLAFSNAQIFIEKGKGDFIQVIKKALAGREGGLPAVIDMISDGFINDTTEKYVNYILNTSVAPFDYDKKVAFMQTYLDEFSHVLPEERLMSAHELAANFEAFVKFHLEWINSFRNAVK